MPDPQQPVVPVPPTGVCQTCGFRTALVRGRRLSDPMREVCPTCLAERMDAIRDVVVREVESDCLRNALREEMCKREYRSKPWKPTLTM